MSFIGKAVEFRPLLENSKLAREQDSEFWLVGDTQPTIIKSVSKFTAINHVSEVDVCLQNMSAYGIHHLISLDPKRLKWRLSILACLRNWQKISSGDVKTIFSEVSEPFNFVYSEKFNSNFQKNEIVEKVLSTLEQNQIKPYFNPVVQLCLDEMILNAIHNAPYADGKFLYRAVERHNKVVLPEGKVAQVDIALSENNIAVFCTDPYGSLEVNYFLKYLSRDKDEKDRSKMSQGTAGAGLGCLMMLQYASEYGVIVNPGVFTVFFIILNRKSKMKNLETKHKSLHFATRKDYE